MKIEETATDVGGKEAWDDSALSLQINHTLRCKFAFIRIKNVLNA